MKEIWKDIKGYEGLYKVSNLGKVYSIAYKKCLSPRSDRGYLCILLHKSGNKKYFLIHRLVAEAFIPNPNNYPQVNHKDENKQNNHGYFRGAIKYMDNSYNQSRSIIRRII